MKPRWTPEEREQVRALVADGLNSREIALIVTHPRKGITDAVAKYQLGPWLAKPGIKPGTRMRAAPDDFADLAARLTHYQLRGHYRVAASTITRWAREVGMGKPAGGMAVPMPENFPHLAPTMTQPQARAMYGRGETVLLRWCREAGVKFKRRTVGVPRSSQSPVDRNQRDMTRAGQAADFLRRFGPVFRSDAEGNPKPSGTHWRRGRFVLTDDDVLERAEHLGFAPEAWRTLATPIPTINHEGPRA